jgi:hypothetical protein
VTARTDSSDYDKQVAIDDLTFDAPTTPPMPDFTLTPQSTFVNVVQGSSTTDGITIGRIGGSNGNVALAVSGTLPAGVHAQIAPNPAPGTSSTLTLTADPTAPPTLGAPRTITVTGTPAGAGVGSAPRSFQCRDAGAADDRAVRDDHRGSRSTTGTRSSRASATGPPVTQAALAVALAVAPAVAVDPRVARRPRTRGCPHST